MTPGVSLGLALGELDGNLADAAVCTHEILVLLRATFRGAALRLLRRLIRERGYRVEALPFV